MIGLDSRDHQGYVKWQDISEIPTIIKVTIISVVILKIHILCLQVNNAYTGVNTIISNMGKKFWEVPEDQWDIINGVGLRGHYFCTVKASRWRFSLIMQI